MTETIYQQQYNPSIHIQQAEEDDTFNYYYNKPKKLSFSQLLQKKSSLLSRKISVFKKPKLEIAIPSQLSRSSSLSTTSTEPNTPTMGSLEMAVTQITDTHNPLLDYTGKGYSNFYIKLSNGNWMVRIRDANRKIIATLEIDGSMV